MHGDSRSFLNHERQSSVYTILLVCNRRNLYINLNRIDIDIEENKPLGKQRKTTAYQNDAD